MVAWLARRWYDVVFWSSFLWFTFGWSLRVIGRRNMPSQGPVLVLCNHQSYFDPVLIGLASRRYLVYLARIGLFKNALLAKLIKSLDAIPIQNEGGGKDGIVATLDKLKKGLAVLIFPEGERTVDGDLHPFKPGVTLLLKKMNVKIVPVAIAGGFDCWPRTKMLPKPALLLGPPIPGTMAISIGKPIDSHSLTGLSRETILEKLYEAVKVEWHKAEKIRRKERV